jgi:ABC-2 type transport system permease protein
MLGDVDAAGLRVTSSWPVWLSPIGWGQQMRPFGGAHAWPAALFAVTTVGLVLAAAGLVRRRDLGRGLWPERRGRARAASSLLSPVGLVWRLQRGVLLGWGVGLLGFGLIFGTLTGQIADLSGSAAEWYTTAGGTDVVIDAYQTMIVAMAGMFVSIYVVQVMLRMHTDEAGGTLESVLATGATRRGWVGAHLLVAGAGAVLLLLAFTIPMGLATGGQPGGPVDVTGRLVLAGLVQLPGVLVLAALVVAAVGLLPRWAVPVSWALLVVAILIGPMFGPSLDLPTWLQDLSPFTHTPKVPATDPAVTPLLTLLLVGGALVAAGTVAVRRRALLLPA